MTSITLRENGYIITLKELVDFPTAQKMAFQMRDEWAGTKEPFVWMIDARTFTMFAADAQALFEELLTEALDRGLLRITVLAKSTAFAGLFCNMMVRADAMSLYQFLDVAYEKNFEEEMEEWLTQPFSSSSSS